MIRKLACLFRGHTYDRRLMGRRPIPVVSCSRCGMEF